MRVVLIFVASISFFRLSAQVEQDLNDIKDSLYIVEIEGKKEPEKVLHAEPLFIDLIRDLGARKGEKEWNVGFGLTDNGNFDRYNALVEYEWAPVDRLGLEVELPFSFYYPLNDNTDVPQSKMNSVKIAAQYSFFVSEKKKTSMALGYIHEFELTEFNNYGKKDLLKGNLYNPFFVAAKRWGNNFHTLLYTGPSILNLYPGNSWQISWQVNSNFHYMITGTRNFIGIELNKNFQEGDFDMTIRPQMRVGLADNIMVGIVAGIPVSRENERLSAFLRLIYEPKHH